MNTIGAASVYLTMNYGESVLNGGLQALVHGPVRERVESAFNRLRGLLECLPTSVKVLSPLRIAYHRFVVGAVVEAFWTELYVSCLLGLCQSSFSQWLSGVAPLSSIPLMLITACWEIYERPYYVFRQTFLDNTNRVQEGMIKRMYAEFSDFSREYFGYTRFLKGFWGSSGYLNETDSSGMALLHHACRKGDIPMIQLLLRAGGDVNVVTTEGNFLAAFLPRPWKDIGVVAQNGLTSLFFACDRRDEVVIPLLKENGGNFLDEGRTTILMYAAYTNDVVLAKLAVEIGDDIDAQDEQGDTPLHSACERGNQEMVDWLLANGANVNISNFEIDEETNAVGQFPLFYAYQNRNEKIMTTLQVHDGIYLYPGITPFHYAAMHGDQEGTELAYRTGGKVNAIDRNGNTALHLAYQHGHNELADSLITKGADDSIQNFAKQTPQELVQV